METNDAAYELDIDPATVCRICLSQSGQLLNLFSNSIIDGYVVRLPEVLSYTLDIVVDRNDSLPPKICGDCKKQVTEFYTFKEKSKRIDKSLQDMFQKTTDDIKLEENTIELDEAEAETEAESYVSCSLCDKQFRTDEEFYQHVEIDHEQPVTEIEMENESLAEIEEEIPGQSDELLFDDIGFEDDANYIYIPAEKPDTRAKRAASSTANPLKSKRVKKESVSLTADSSEENETFEEYQNEDDLSSELVDSDGGNDLNPLNIDQFQCVLCSTSFSNRSKYIEHCKNHDHSCVVCNRVFGDADSLAAHEIVHEKGDFTKGAKRVYSEFIRDDMFCIPCNKRLKSNSQVEQHYKMHDAISMVVNYMEFYPCHDCQTVYASEDKLSAHLKEIHSANDKTVTSKVQPLKVLEERVDESYLDYQFLEDERDTDYKEGQYYCGECEIMYPSARDVKNHAVLHQTKFKCPINGCGCQYDQLSRLSIHIVHKHINSANLQCLHCQEAFETYDKLQAHMKKECKEKKYKCHECDKKFFSKKALLTHLKTLKEKKYVCNFCGKTFKQQGELTIHTRSHTNERPFQCTICEKSYKTSSMRAAHMDSHITGKTFECDLCQKKLQSRTSYRNHMKRHTEEKKHVCECGKKFFTKYHLKLHYSKIHEKNKNLDEILIDLDE